MGLAVGTRPDCVPDTVLDLFESLAEEFYVSVEFGMQTMHQPGLDWMNRAHTHDHMINAIERSRGRGFECCVHIILGIPGETHAMMMETAEEVARLGFDAVKLHNLYAVEGTPLGDQVRSGEITLMERDEYVRTVVDFLERLPADMIIERISGEAPPGYLIAPAWCAEKSILKLDIENEFAQRGTRQGSRCTAPPVRAPSERPADNTPQSIRSKIDVRGRLPVLRIEG